MVCNTSFYSCFIKYSVFMNLVKSKKNQLKVFIIALFTSCLLMAGNLNLFVQLELLAVSTSGGTEKMKAYGSFAYLNHDGHN